MKYNIDPKKKVGGGFLVWIKGIESYTTQYYLDKSKELLEVEYENFQNHIKEKGPEILNDIAECSLYGLKFKEEYDKNNNMTFEEFYKTFTDYINKFNKRE